MIQNLSLCTNFPLIVMTAKSLSNLKIYCQNEQDQSNIFDFIYFEYRNSVAICTWEPDPVDTGTWGMFVDDFPMELWDKLVEYLESEDSWALDDEVEMVLECDGVYKEYPQFLEIVGEGPR